MSFANRHPTVARLLGMADAGASDDQRRDDSDQADGDGNDGQDGDDAGDDQGDGNDAGGEGQDQGGDQGGSGGEASTLLADLDDSERNALVDAFERDSRALVSAERERCIDAFTSDSGRRSPNAAARLLRTTGLGATDISETLAEVGTSGRSGDRNRLRASDDTRTTTGRAPADQPGASSSAREAQKAKREKRNAAVKEKGGVKANRTEFDPG